jgi:RNA-directed DNA polymerase
MEGSVSGVCLQVSTEQRISSKAIKRFKNRIREITRRVRGRRIEIIVKKLRRYMLSWKVNFTQMQHVLRGLDSWVKQ